MEFGARNTGITVYVACESVEYIQNFSKTSLEAVREMCLALEFATLSEKRE